MPLSRTMEQVKQDTYDGWTLVSVDDSGGVLLQSPTGKRRRVWFQTVEIERLEKKNDQLRAIVDKLPRTADGVVVVPRMDLYKRASHKDAEGLWNVVPRPRVDAIEANGIVRRHGHESGWLERASELYASRYAATGEAEQAAEPQPDSPKPTCETCRFWWGRKIDGCGDCQRFPPTHDQDGLGVFPLNYAESWCGEHQPREDK